MKRKLYAILICLVVLSVLTGCQLAQKDADGNMAEDRLAGIFLTTEYLDLFDMEGYMNDNLNSFQGGKIIIDGNSEAYQERLYAAQTTKALTNEDTGEQSETEDYVFPIDGISYFSARMPQTETHEGYVASFSAPAISEGHVHYSIGDSEDSVTLTGIIYVSPSSIEHTYFFNPVYQSADGSIYAVSGSGFMVSTEAYSEGSVYSQTMDAAVTITENGQAKTYSTSVTISIHVMFTPEKIVILQMDKESSILSQAEYAPDAMPESIAAEPEADYFIVEIHKRDDMDQTKISRTIYGRDAETIETFAVQENGICISQLTHILWPEAEK